MFTCAQAQSLATLVCWVKLWGLLAAAGLHPATAVWAALAAAAAMSTYPMVMLLR